MDGAPVDRLRRREDFERVFQCGRQAASRFLVLRWAPNGGACTRVGFAVGRQLGGAVVRNRLRRRWREVVRRGPRLSPGWDVVVVARGAGKDAEWAALAGAWQQALARCGLLAPRG